MQLTSSGIQDNYITGNPQITFFKSVYRRHTNFAIETIQQIIDGDLGTENSSTNSTVKITKTADLLSGIYVVCPQKTGGIDANELIDNVEIVIGGTLIDRHTNEWMKVWNELTVDTSKKEGFKYMVGGFSCVSEQQSSAVSLVRVPNDQASVIFPLNFWFCRHVGLSLPLIAIQYHDIILKIEWGVNSTINRDSSTSVSSLCEIWCDNVFLDSEERKRFGENEHEYLIEQVQIIDTINESPSSKFKLNGFNHPLKEIIWTENDTGANKITNEKMNITINGIERLSEQYKEYYTLQQPYKHHKNIPSYNVKEHEDPLYLDKPIDTGIRDHFSDVNNSGDVSSSQYNTRVKIGENHIEYNLNATSVFKVGDIINIWRSGITMTQLVTITAIEDNGSSSPGKRRINFTPNLYNYSLPADDTDLRSYIVARRDYSKASFSIFNKNIYVYSFCLNPEEHQPSGSCNFSRLDDCKLSFTSNVSIDKVFATNYNILRIANGLTNLRFSN